MYQFNYVKVGSVADAVAALGWSGEAKLLAGGQTLIPTLKQRLATPGTMIDLSGIADLKVIRREGNTLVIGAMATHAEVARHADVKAAIPALAKLAGGIGDPAVRHAGTIGGSVANNDPAADYPAAVLALNATVLTNKREIAADSYFQGLFTTALDASEIITAIRFPVPEKAAYAKYEQRASRYALVGVFVAKGSGGVRVAVTGAGSSGVFGSTECEKALTASFTAEALKAVTLPATGLLSDLHASAEYRAAMIPVVAARAVAMA